MRCALLGFALGVIVLQQQALLPPLVWSAWLAVPLAVALAAAWASRRSTGAVRRVAGVIALVSVAALTAGAGFFYAAMRAEVRLADELPPAWEGRDIDLIGVIDELPQSVERGTRFVFAVERAVTDGAVVPSRLSLAWYAALGHDVTVRAVPELRAGERWQLRVRLKRPHGTVNPHGFDVEAWLLENGFRATGYVRNDDRNARLDAFAGRASDYVQRARTAVRDRIVEALPGAPYAGVIVALTIGEQRAIPEAQWRIFNRTGVTHLISISGLHVTVFAAIAGGIAYLLARRSVRLTEHVPARKVAALVGAIAATL